MKFFIIFILIFCVTPYKALATAEADAWQNLQFTELEKPAALPEIYETEFSNLSRLLNGRETDFFSKVGWNEGAEKVMIWAPRLNFKNRSLNHYKIEKMIFLNLKNGGVLFCKGCLWQESYKSYSWINVLNPTSVAEAACTQDGLRDIRALNGEISQHNLLKSLKTCQWSLTEMIKKTYEEVVHTAKQVVSGAIFRDLLKVVTHLEDSLIQFRENIVPLLGKIKDQLGEIYDQLVCDFTQKNIRAVVMGIVLPGGGTTGAVAKVALNIERLKENLTLWSKNKHLFDIIMNLKIKYGGKIPPHLLASLSEIKSDLPVAAKPFGSRLSRQSHFVDHSELGFKTVEAYEHAALKFAEKKSETSLILQAPTSKRWIKFDPQTKEYVVMNKNGELITYFKKDRFTSEQAFENFLKEYHK